MESKILCWRCKWGAAEGFMHHCKCPQIKEREITGEEFIYPVKATIAGSCCYFEIG